MPIIAVVAFVLTWRPEPVVLPVETEMEKSLSLAAAQTPSNIGSKIGDKRRLTAAQKLEVLRSQLVDPHRNLTFDGELRAEIDRLERRLGVKVASKEGR